MQRAPGEHDPSRLVALARRLQRSGVDLTITTVTLSDATIRGDAIARAATPVSFRMTPVQRNGAPYGLRVTAVTNDSLFASFGLRDGDVITSMNGYRVPSIGAEVIRIHGRPEGLGVTEIVRAGRHMVIAVIWNRTAGARLSS
jgi:type II secretory pathway component PulC